ncbi:MAG: CDP-diacylglycerol--glycerol-3-phosphate 3-phosphatidyltransferase [Magnetococcales bacterium]|nr:CDP-diacylglycerol--glycerol-3-phosphate 3-phosphatidyltransferase [Magnetococcales bacterium]
MQWNLPNLLTALRIVLIPVFIALAHLPGRWGFLLSTAFFGIAALTDWADGYVARKRGLLTPFGRFFDPVADKLLVLSALLLLVSEARAPLFLVLLIMAREITVMALREFMSGRGLAVPVSRTAKWKTGFQMTAILMLMVQDSLFGIPFQAPGLVCLFVAAALAVFSASEYFRQAWPAIRNLAA